MLQTPVSFHWSISCSQTFGFRGVGLQASYLNMVCTVKYVPFAHPFLTGFPTRTLYCKRNNDLAIHAIEPRYSVQRFEDGHVIEIELPGVDKKNVSVEVKDRAVTVAGTRSMVASDLTGKNTEDGTGTQERNHDRAGTGAEVKRESTERGVQYEVTLRVPEEADTNMICAEMNDGLLVVKVPKKQSQSRTISFSS